MSADKCVGDRACVFPVVANGLCVNHLRERKEAEYAARPKPELIKIAPLATVSETILIHGTDFTAKAKAPFIRSGESVLGAIEYDKTTELIKCHICGQWFQWLPTHIDRAHDVSAKDYRDRYGLASDNPLCTPKKVTLFRHLFRKRNMNSFGGKSAASFSRMGVKARKRKRVTPVISAETKNLRRICRAQLIDRLKKIADKNGHTPTGTEMQKEGVCRQTLMLAFGSVAEAMIAANLTPNKSGVKIS